MWGGEPHKTLNFGLWKCKSQSSYLTLHSQNWNLAFHMWNLNLQTWNGTLHSMCEFQCSNMEYHHKKLEYQVWNLVSVIKFVSPCIKTALLGLQSGTQDIEPKLLCSMSGHVDMERGLSSMP